MRLIFTIFFAQRGRISSCVYRNSNVSGERSPFEGSCCSGQDISTESDVEEVPKYRVVLLGDSGVGKTALVSQFMTSEYINTYDASLGKSMNSYMTNNIVHGKKDLLK